MAFEEELHLLPDGWGTTTLGELCDAGGGDIQTGPFGSQLHSADYVSVGVPSIMPTNIVVEGIQAEGIARIPTQDAERLHKYRVRDGDIVYSRRGDVEKCARATAKEDGWLCGTGCLRVRLGSAPVSADFVHAYLSSPPVRAWIVRHSVGATMPNLNTGILRSLPMTIPPPEEMDYIGEIWVAFIKKTNQLSSANQTLQAMAMAIFKSWFVDFDPVRAKAEGREPEGMDAATAALFPHEFEDSRIGPIPEGWTAIPLHDIAGFSNGAAYKGIHFSPADEGLPVIKIAELKAGVTDSTRFTAIDLGKKYLIEQEEILFSWSGNPDTSIDTFIWDGGPAWLNQHIFRVRENGTASRAWVYIQLKTLRPKFAEIARDKQTTGLGHVTVADMKRLMVCKPTAHIALRFDEIAGPVFKRIASNQLMSRVLASLRDTLMPRLISGKLRIPEAEKLVEAVL